MKLDFNEVVRNTLMEQKAIRELLEKIDAGDFGEGNSEIVKEFFDFLCIDVSKKESEEK